MNTVLAVQTARAVAPIEAVEERAFKSPPDTFDNPMPSISTGPPARDFNHLKSPFVKMTLNVDRTSAPADPLSWRV